MDTVLVLMARPGSAALGAEVMAAARRVADAGPLTWLAEGEACEVAFPAPARFEARAVEDGVRALVGDAPIDVAVVPCAGRRKRLLVADMDSTVIGQECIDELGMLAGKGVEIAAITERAMRGELEFSDALKARVAMLSGADAQIIERIGPSGSP